MPGEPERDLVGFEELVHRHVDMVFHVACTWANNPEEAEELTQIAFIKAWRAFDRFRVGTNFKAWILKILRNVFLDRKRAARTAARTVSLDQLSPGTEPEEPVREPQAIDLESKEIFYDVFGDEIAGFVRGIPAEFQLAVLLCDVEGLNYREIAEVLDFPIGTVRSRIHRGRALLADQVREYAKQVGYLRERKA